jgi:hypothetical protein
MMSGMGFRQVLAELAILDEKGVVSFDSKYVSVMLKRSVAETSKRLCRLHAMGFLKRKRLKRLCISKHGKRCQKGYYYKYSLSAQGRKYTKYMAWPRVAEAAFYYDFYKKAIPHLDEESKTRISHLAFCSESRKFKGSNQALQTLGLASTIAIPQLASKVAEENMENSKLLISEAILKDTVAKQAGTIGNLEALVAVLMITLGSRNATISRQNETISILTKLLSQNLIFDNQSMNVLMTLLSAYKAWVKDLTVPLFFLNPKLVEYYFNRQQPLIQKAEEQLDACRASLQKAAAPSP